MKHQQCAHLHVHTDASLRDGLGTVSRLIATAKDLGFGALAMTDHGTLANAVSFTIEAKAAGIKPLLGMEGYVVVDGEIGHITLLADGQRGWESLLQLNRLAHASNWRQPAFTIDELTAHSDGLVCLTGCISSPLQQMSLEDAIKLGYRLKSAFGPRLFAELMFVGETLAWERPIKIAERLGLSRVITNDVHFPISTDATIHPILTKMKSGFDYDSSQLYLKTQKELMVAATRFGMPKEEAIDMLHRTARIASKLGEVALEREPALPKRRIVGGIRGALESKSRFMMTINPKYNDRLNYELEVVKEMGYEDYFLILDDIISYARDKGIFVGPGRGSGAGSLILYLLGITDVDPIVHGLQFERFLNPERKGMPDVDVDIESERREEVLEYAAEKYGAVPIATYARYSHKSLTRDLGKMFRIDQELIGDAADGGANSDAFKMIADEYPEFVHSYESFMGQIRHKGKHAGGVIITETPVPIERVGDTLAAAWTEGKSNELSYAGIVKFDLLGLSVLSALARLRKQMGFDPPYPEDDHPAFTVFQEGDLSGVFQFAGSDGIRKLTMELVPNSLDDLVAINALYRPGAIDAGAMEMYPKWKSSPRKVHPLIDDILAPTYGAIVFQEQMMAIYQRIVGGTLGDADTARRIISKGKDKVSDPRWVKKFDELHKKFVDSAYRIHGLSFSEAERLWSEIATHVRYSFNKAHATAYSLIAWDCAWWKYAHPAHFYAAMLNVDSENEQTYIMDAVKSGINISPPTINEATDEYVASNDGKSIFLPLSAIKGLGPSGVSGVLDERELGPFTDVKNFMERVPKRLVRSNAREGLWMMGSFNSICPEEPADIEKLLAIKELPISLSSRDRQLKYLGYIIPTRRMLDEFERLEKTGFTCGIVDSLDHRESKYGPYTVYRLSPSGVFWSRDVSDLQKGEVLAVKISEKNGRAMTIKRI